ncbi:MAG: hypothetical protein JNJ83_08510 [Verrucomicrobiaceae bacterium]|nr:hypothetical protein [Verrucomicrobiaceae bacterium]
MNLPDRHRSPAPLPFFRRLSRSAWLLHGYLIGTLCLLPVSGGLQADDPIEESLLRVTLTIGGGSAAEVPAGNTRTVTALVERVTWLTWIENGIWVSGPETVVAVEGASISASVSADGSATSAATESDAQGQHATTFTMGNAESVLEITATKDGASATASATFTPPAPEEEWTDTAQQGYVTANLSVNGGTANLSYGDQRQMTVHVQYTTFTVQTSNFGNTRSVNYNTADASSASVSWSLAPGDPQYNPSEHPGTFGTLADSTAATINVGGTLSNSTEPNGTSSTTFTMGDLPTLVQLEVIYAGTDSTSTSVVMQGQPESNWQLTNTTSQWVISGLWSDGSMGDVIPNQTRQVLGTLFWVTYNTYTDQYGNTSTDELWEPAPGVSIDFSIATGGDATLSNESPLTEYDGTFSTTLTMGQLASEVNAAFVLGSLATEPITFSPAEETWNDYVDSSNTVLVTSANTEVSPGESTTLSAEVQTTWTRAWTSNLGNTYTEPLEGGSTTTENITFTVTSGTAGLSDPWDEGAQDYIAIPGSKVFTMGAVNSGTATVQVSAPNPENPGDTLIANITVQEGEFWELAGNETTITLVRSHEGPIELAENATAELGVTVHFTEWEIWTGNRGSPPQRRFISDGTALDATVSFAVHPEDMLPSPYANASLSATTNIPTDENGSASTTVTMGYDSARIQVTANFLATTATTVFQLVPPSNGEPEWYAVGEGEGLRLTLEDEDSDRPVIITRAEYGTWTIEKRRGSTEIRGANETWGPAGGAEIQVDGQNYASQIWPFDGHTPGHGHSAQLVTSPQGEARLAYETSAPLPLLVSATFSALSTNGETTGMRLGGGSDTDGDGLSDADEIANGSAPDVVDTDGDGLTDGFERQIGTNPLLADTDGDGVVDGTEVTVGDDPLDGQSYAASLLGFSVSTVVESTEEETAGP